MAEESHKVSLNVYDLSQGMARQLSMTFLGKAIEGIWHTGIVVYGNEYYFGDGIKHDPVGQTPYGTPLRSVDLGVTHVPKDVFEIYLQEISPGYTAQTYSLLNHNCNNFSNEVAQFLVSTTIPDYILQLPNEVMNSPMGALFLPMIQQLEETLRSGAVPQGLQMRPHPSGQANMRAAATSQVTHIKNGELQSAPGDARAEQPGGVSDVHKHEEAKKKMNEDLAKPSSAGKSCVNGADDPLGDARSKVQEEISQEFAAIMASGTLRASEAAALATRRVMQRHGHLNVAMPHN